MLFYYKCSVRKAFWVGIFQIENFQLTVEGLLPGIQNFDFPSELFRG